MALNSFKIIWPCDMNVTDANANEGVIDCQIVNIHLKILCIGFIFMQIYYVSCYFILTNN